MEPTGEPQGPTEEVERGTDEEVERGTGEREEVGPHAETDERLVVTEGEVIPVDRPRPPVTSVVTAPAADASAVLGPPFTLVSPKAPDEKPQPALVLEPLPLAKVSLPGRHEDPPRELPVKEPELGREGDEVEEPRVRSVQAPGEKFEAGHPGQEVEGDRGLPEVPVEEPNRLVLQEPEEEPVPLPAEAPEPDSAVEVVQTEDPRVAVVAEAKGRSDRREVVPRRSLRTTVVQF